MRRFFSMKKLFALLLAALMLLTCAACAETAGDAGAIKISDLTANIDADGETMNLDLAGLELVIAGGQAGETPAARVEINGNGSKLFGLTVNLASDYILVGIDGMSKTFSVQIPESATSVTNLDFSSLDIDVDALLETIMSGAQISQDGDTTTISIPHTVITDVILQVVPAMESMNIEGFDLEQVTQELQEMKEADSGVAIEVVYTENEAGTSGKIGAFQVENGGQSDVPAFTANFEMDDASFSASVEIEEAGTFGFSFAPEGETGESLRVTINVDAEGTKAEISGLVSVSEAEMTFDTLDATNAINVAEMTEEDTEAIQGELISALGGLLGYFFSVMGAAA